MMSAVRSSTGALVRNSSGQETTIFVGLREALPGGEDRARVDDAHPIAEIFPDVNHRAREIDRTKNVHVRLRRERIDEHPNLGPDRLTVFPESA